nr:putative wall-associated receptor kinase-like 16 [Ziziphus jujuba var. spinosa]
MVMGLQGILKNVSSMAIGILLVLATTTKAAAQSALDCRESCGDLKVPYPFGMDREGCYLGKKFVITCNQSFHPPKAFLMRGNVEVTNISLDDGELSITNFIGRDCYDETTALRTYRNRPRLNLPFYTVSSTKNKFFAVGCDTNAFVEGYRGTERYATGCISSCDSVETFNESCSGVGCCQTSIPYGIKNVTVVVNSYYNHSGILDFDPCSFAFVVDESKFKFSHTSFKDLQNIEELPMVINWAIGDESGGDYEHCYEAEKSSNFACKNNSKCIVHDGSGGYRCQCLTGYQGNPYHRDGCQDVDECENISNPCNPGKCHNLPGNWTCTCPKGYRIINGTACSQSNAIDQSARLLVLYIALGVSLALLVAVSMMCWGVKKIKLRKLKKKFFEQNGGLMLRQRLSNLETAKIFTAEELKRATNNYDENRVIGEGGYGKVYKGILPDGQEVAIKKSKIGDETQTAQFINEMVILLQINHRNVVKLLGCCLETEVPSLVYKFITNGTLFQHIHEKGKAPLLPWKVRVKIASETAGALAYLHSATSTPIIHRDVKTSNILLDENYMAKVSDFGASKLIPIDQNQLTTLVQGTLGYLDPEYFHSSQLTEKSDVYSFGVVLAELLTSKEVVSFNRPEGERNLAMFFVTAIEEDCLLHVLDGDIVDEANVDEVKKVANLAKMCLSVKGEERPTMKEVANELEGLINLDEHPWQKVDLIGEENEYLLGSSSNAYENSSGESGFRSNGTATIGYDSMKSQMLSPYNDAR